MKEGANIDYDYCNKCQSKTFFKTSAEEKIFYQTGMCEECRNKEQAKDEEIKKPRVSKWELYAKECVDRLDLIIAQQADIIELMKGRK